MEIQEYQFETAPLDQALVLIDRLYTPSVNLELYKQGIRNLLTESNPFYQFGTIKNFLALDKDNPVGHISAILDQRTLGIGYVGFFEAANAETSHVLIQKATDYLKMQGVTSIRGPVNLSIWHSYRFITQSDSTPNFLFEMISRPEYPSYFKDNGFVPIENFFSGKRQDFNDILNYTEAAFATIQQKGFHLRIIDLENFEAELSIFHQLSLKIFKASNSFTPISFAEFKQLYSEVKEYLDQNYCEFLCLGDREIGFCFSIPDFTNPEKTLIFKTIGLLPEYQQQNLGLALIHSQHAKAKRDNYQSIIYALIRQNNSASKINPYGAKIFRQYILYELTV